MSVFIFRQSDDTPRHVAFVLIACSEISSRRSAVEHRNTQTLSASEYDISSPFTRRHQQGECQDIGIYGNFASCFVSAGCKFTVIFYASAVVWILNDTSEDIRRKLQILIAACLYLHTLRDGARMYHSQHLWEDFFIYK